MEFLLAIILVWAVIFGLVSGAWKEKAIAVARKQYLEALAVLRHAPNNPDLRQRAYTLGRAYIKLIPDTKGRVVFDEIVLRKDIEAACAAPSTAEQAESAAAERYGLH